MGMLHGYHRSGVVGRDSDGCGEVVLVGCLRQGIRKSTLSRKRDGAAWAPRVIVGGQSTRCAESGGATLTYCTIPESESESFQITQTGA